MFKVRIKKMSPAKALRRKESDRNEFTQARANHQYAYIHIHLTYGIRWFSVITGKGSSGLFGLEKSHERREKAISESGKTIKYVERKHSHAYHRTVDTISRFFQIGGGSSGR